MHTTKLLFSRIRGKRVRISCLVPGSTEIRTYEGVVTEDYTTVFDYYIELDHNCLVQSRTIETIDILD